MKKSFVLFVLAITLSLIFTFHLVISADAPPDASTSVGNALGVNPDTIPTSTDQIKTDYLKQEWTKMIENNHFFGPVHNFLLAHPKVISVILGTSYEFSLKFFVILVFWIFIFIVIYRLINSTHFVKGGYAFAISLALIVIFAQIGLYSWLGLSTLNLIFSQQDWWMRLIIGIIIFGVIAVAWILSHLASQYLAQEAKKKKESQAEQKQKEVKNLVEGMEDQGSGI